MTSETIVACDDLAGLAHADRQHLAKGTAVLRSRFLGRYRNVLRKDRPKVHQRQEWALTGRASVVIELLFEFSSTIGEVERNRTSDAHVHMQAIATSHKGRSTNAAAVG